MKAPVKHTCPRKDAQGNRAHRQRKVEITAAIVDRLTFSGQIIETGTTSYRLAHARATKKT